MYSQIPRIECFTNFNSHCDAGGTLGGKMWAASILTQQSLSHPKPKPLCVQAGEGRWQKSVGGDKNSQEAEPSFLVNQAPFSLFRCGACRGPPPPMTLCMPEEALQRLTHGHLWSLSGPQMS